MSEDTEKCSFFPCLVHAEQNGNLAGWIEYTASDEQEVGIDHYINNRPCLFMQVVSYDIVKQQVRLIGIVRVRAGHGTYHVHCAATLPIIISNEDFTLPIDGSAVEHWNFVLNEVCETGRLIDIKHPCTLFDKAGTS